MNGATFPRVDRPKFVDSEFPSIYLVLRPDRMVKNLERSFVSLRMTDPTADSPLPIPALGSHAPQLPHNRPP
jgi:hypothetical protein